MPDLQFMTFITIMLNLYEQQTKKALDTFKESTFVFKFCYFYSCNMLLNYQGISLSQFIEIILDALHVRQQ